MTALPISAQVMCRSCQEPTPADDLAVDAQGILTDLCRWCLEEADEDDDEPELVPSRWATMTDLPDIANYQEPHNG